MKALLILMVLVGTAVADTPLWMRARKYALDAGASPQASLQFGIQIGKTDQIIDWKVPGIPAPTPEQLAAVKDPEIGGLPNGELVNEGGTIRARTQAEKDAAAARAKEERAASKPAARQKLENRYLRICNDVLKLAGDVRADATPRALLTVAELYDVLEKADTKNVEKELNKVSRQLMLVLFQLQSDTNWYENLTWNPAVGE